MYVEIGYDATTDEIIGRCIVGQESGDPLVFTEREGGVKEYADALVKRWLRRQLALRRNEVGFDEVGFFGFVKKAWNKVKKEATKVAKKVKVYGALKKVVKTAKTAVKTARKIYEHPAFAAAVGVVSASVPGGAAIAAGYAGSRAALALYDKMRAGDPEALAQIGGYAAEALKGSPEGKKAMALFESVKSTTKPVALKDNPWLKGISEGINFAT